MSLRGLVACVALVAATGACRFRANVGTLAPLTDAGVDRMHEDDESEDDFAHDAHFDALRRDGATGCELDDGGCEGGT